MKLPKLKIKASHLAERAFFVHVHNVQNTQSDISIEEGQRKFLETKQRTRQI